MILIPIVIVITIYFINEIKRLNKYLLPLIATISIATSLIFQSNDINSGDDTPHYTNLCEIQKEAVNYLEQNFEYNQAIQTSFLFKHSIERPLTGCLSSNKKFTNVVDFTQKNNKKNGVFVFVSSELPEVYQKTEIIKTLLLLKRFEKRNVWIEIYKK